MFNQNIEPSVAQTSSWHHVWELACSVFRWEGLPDGLFPASEVLEKTLLVHGCGGLYNVAFNGTEFFSYFPSINSVLDQWGEPAPVHSRPLIIGSSIVYSTGGGFIPLLLFDNNSRRPLLTTLVYYSELLTSLQNSIKILIKLARTPYIINADDQTRNNASALARDLMSEKAVIVRNMKSLDDLDGAQLVSNMSIEPSTLTTLIRVRDEVLSQMSEIIGVPDFSSLKGAQLTLNEVLLPTLPTQLKLRQRLILRQEWAAKVNDILGTQIIVRCPALEMISMEIARSGMYQEVVEQKIEHGMEV